jgi:hypothetical protein
MFDRPDNRRTPFSVETLNGILSLDTPRLDSM